MDDPFGHFVLRKQLIPVRSNRESIGPDTENQCEAFVKELLFEHYEHVFVNKVSEEFRDECGGCLRTGRSRICRFSGWIIGRGLS